MTAKNPLDVLTDTGRDRARARELAMSEPRIEKARHGRKITADWLVKTDPDGKRHYASMNVTYNQGGMNYFSGRNETRAYQASIGREGEEDSSIGGVMRSFRLFSAVGFIRSEPVGRFSAKKLDEFFDVALARLRELVDQEEERVLRFFDANAEPTRD